MHTILMISAAKNLARNAKRTLLIGGGLAIGACGVLLFDAFTKSTYQNLSESFAHSEGHLQIARAGWFDRTKKATALAPRAELESVRKRIEENPSANSYVRAMTLKREVSGLVSSGEQTTLFSGIGVEPGPFNEVSRSTYPLEKGRSLRDDDTDAVVIGNALAERLKVGVGDTVMFLANDEFGRSNMIEAAVVGVLRKIDPVQDAYFLMLPLPKVTELKGSDSVQVLSIGLNDTGHTDAARREIEIGLSSSPNGLVAKTWLETAEYYQGVKGLYSRLFLFIHGILGAMTLILVANTMTMAALERTREVSMLRAIGASRLQVGGLFLLEGAFLGFASSAVGVVFAFAIAGVVSLFGGIPMPAAPGQATGYQLNFLVDFHGGFMILGSFTLASSLASVLPALGVSRGNIARGLAGSLAALVLWAASTPSRLEANAGSDGSKLLKAIDDRRGNLSDGFVTEATFVELLDGKERDKQVYRVATQGEKSIAVRMLDAAGRRLIIRSDREGMWLQKENIRKALRISPAQRLIGTASNADVVSVRFGTDYEFDTLEKAEGGNSVLVLKPKAGNEAAAYGRIRIVTPNSGEALSAEFFTVSGALLKKSTFEYGGANKSLTSTLITDAVNPKASTRVVHGKAVARSFASGFFNLQSLMQSAANISNGEL